MSETELAKQCAELVAEYPHMDFVGLRHKLEFMDISMASAERLAVLARAIEQACAGGDVETPHEVDDTDADKAAYDYEPEPEVEIEDSPSLAGVFTEPAVEGKLAEFEATPPGKSAGDRKLDQLTTERTDQHERPAPESSGAGGESNSMSEKIEAPASNGGPQEKFNYEQQHYKVKDEAGKVESPPPGIHEGQKHPGTNGRDPWPGASDEDAERMAALFAGNEVEHVYYSDPEPGRYGRNGVKFRPTYKTVPGAVTVEHWQQHLAGDHPLGIFLSGKATCASLVRLTSTSIATKIRCKLSRRSRAQSYRLCPRGPSPAACT